MPLDINMFRVDRGGDPEIIRESQRRRFAPPEMVDEVREMIALCGVDIVRVILRGVLYDRFL